MQKQKTFCIAGRIITLTSAPAIGCTLINVSVEIEGKEVSSALYANNQQIEANEAFHLAANTFAALAAEIGS